MPSTSGRVNQPLSNRRRWTLKLWEMIMNETTTYLVGIIHYTTITQVTGHNIISKHTSTHVKLRYSSNSLEPNNRNRCHWNHNKNNQAPPHTPKFLQSVGLFFLLEKPQDLSLKFISQSNRWRRGALGSLRPALLVPSTPTASMVVFFVGKAHSLLWNKIDILAFRCGGSYVADVAGACRCQ